MNTELLEGWRHAEPEHRSFTLGHQEGRNPWPKKADAVRVLSGLSGHVTVVLGNQTSREWATYRTSGEDELRARQSGEAGSAVEAPVAAEGAGVR